MYNIILFYIHVTEQPFAIWNILKRYSISALVRKLFVMVLLGYYHILNIHGPERDLGWGDKGARRAQEY